MKDRSINLTDAVRAGLAFDPDDHVVTLFDPGTARSESSSRTGWCVMVDGHQAAHGEGTPYEAFEAALAVHARPRVVVVEEPGYIGLGDQWRLAAAYGALLGCTHERLVRSAASPWDVPFIWTPKPTQWRAAFELNGKTAEVRMAVARLLRVLEALTPEERELAGGADPYSYWMCRPDAASATAMGYSTVQIARSIRAAEREGTREGE